MGLEFNNQNTLQGLGTTNVFANLLSSPSLITDISKYSPTVVQAAENLLNSPKTGSPSQQSVNPVSQSSPGTSTANIQPIETKSTAPSSASVQPSLSKPLIYAGIGAGALLAIKYGVKIGALIIGGVVLYSLVSTELKGASA